MSNPGTVHSRTSQASLHRGREISLTSTSGRSLTLETNTQRAMVILRPEDDPGEHAATPAVEGYSGGYAPANGQHDE
ncbi:hypothetical protein AB0M47_07650 [Hamadaea sp. NPDC051192]|uniref:hypothetical protein n=1 Tax=Hamadaea sp. NPDC051192 TaxID=3154940 RepID=UPI0034475506